MRQWRGLVDVLIPRLNPKPPDDFIASTICGGATLAFSPSFALTDP